MTKFIHLNLKLYDTFQTAKFTPLVTGRTELRSHTYLILQSLEKNNWTRKFINKVDGRPLVISFFISYNGRKVTVTSVIEIESTKLLKDQRNGKLTHLQKNLFQMAQNNYQQDCQYNVIQTCVFQL